MEKLGYIPVLSSAAGSSLTTANWQEAGIKNASFYLEALLMKPGYDFLMTLDNLRSYLGWNGGLILNATLPLNKQRDSYTVQSIYDGSRMSFSPQTIISLIKKLNPEKVVLPQGIETSLVEELKQFSSIKIFTRDSVTVDGMYFFYDKKISTKEFLLQLPQDKPIYVAGDLDLVMMKNLVQYPVVIMETDRPAIDAYLGKVYTSKGTLDLQDTAHSMQFEVIDPHCDCSTCYQKLTRAYLHHLFIHTPLLCQRLLVQHNAFFCNKNNEDSTDP